MQTRAIEQLAEALKRGELPDAQAWDIGAAVWSIVDSLPRPEAGVAVDGVRRAARALNRQRQYDHTRMLGKAWTEVRGFDATIAKHHAQALINLSALDAAQEVVEDGLARIRAPGAGAQALSEMLEYEGLLGRIYKQRFVETGDKDWLVKATDQYLAQYDGSPDKPYWHGINAVALLEREKREGVRRAGLPSPETLASTLQRQVAQLNRRNADDHWQAATLSEAFLAQGKCDQAELWLYRFLHHRAVRAFDVESYDRQLREIWQGGAPDLNTACADRLSAILAAHIARTQSRWSASPATLAEMTQALAADPHALEKNFSGEGSFTVDTIKRMLGVCASIGCVCNTNGERLGTGFLIDGVRLRESFGPGAVFVTNAHVISETLANAIRPADASVTFELESAGAGHPVFYKVKELLFHSAPGDLGVCCGPSENLDVSIVRLDALPDRFTGLDTAKALPLVGPKAKAYVVGHPRGSGLQISLHDSLLLDIDDEERLVHYRTPTDPGSSGSPVFNALWEVIALHHGGSASTRRLHGVGTYEANEGIALSTIRRTLNDQPASGD